MIDVDIAGLKQVSVTPTTRVSSPFPDVVPGTVVMINNGDPLRPVTPIQMEPLKNDQIVPMLTDPDHK